MTNLLYVLIFQKIKISGKPYCHRLLWRRDGCDHLVVIRDQSRPHFVTVKCIHCTDEDDCDSDCNGEVRLVARTGFGCGGSLWSILRGISSWKCKRWLGGCTFLGPRSTGWDLGEIRSHLKSRFTKN